MTCMARALASSGLTSGIPMATCGRWFSPSRLRDLLANIIPMIAVTNLFNRQRSHQTGSRSELIRRVPPGTSARSWIIRGVAPIALPPMPLQNNDRKREVRETWKRRSFANPSVCVILLLCTARSGDAKGLNTGVPTAEARESLVKRSGGNIDQHGSRIYRDSWRPREQPQGCRASAAQAQNHHFYRRVWFGEVIGGL